MRRREVLKTLEDHMDEIQRFGIRSLRLFGSVARDEASQESDVDLLVGFEETPSFSSFMKLRIFLEDLLEAKVDLITEAGLRKRVPQGLRERYGDVPWREIAGMRDFVAHEYFALDLGILWSAIENEVPALLRRVREILAAERVTGD